MPGRTPPAYSRRSMFGAGLATGLTAGAGLGASTLPRRAAAQAGTPAPATPVVDAAQIGAIVIEGLAKYNAMAALAQVSLDGEMIATVAVGESMTGVPATAEMRFRSGAVAIAWVATTVLLLAEQGVLNLDDTIDAWLPDLPMSDQVTLHMLTNMTSGYMDYVPVPAFQTALYADPFRFFSAEERISYGLAQGVPFKPGTNWAYSHTGYVILGQALAAITGQPLAQTIRELVLDPLGLTATLAADDATLPEPVLHAFTGERRQALGLPAGTTFMEESTFWNPSWTLAPGSIQSATLNDLTASAIGFGTGVLLNEESRELMLGKHLVDFGEKVDGCPTCLELTGDPFTYGMGVLLIGDWVVQNPSFAGYAGTAAYLPSQQLAIAVATTNTAAQYDDQGNLKIANASTSIARDLSAALAPGAGLPG